MTDESTALEDFAEALDAWLTERIGNEPDGTTGLVVGWSIMVDLVRPDDGPDNQGWYRVASKPGQRPATTVGQLYAALARTTGSYTQAGIEDYLEGT